MKQLTDYRTALIRLEQAREAAVVAERGIREAEARCREANNLVNARRQDLDDTRRALDEAVRTEVTS